MVECINADASCSDGCVDRRNLLRAWFCLALPVLFLVVSTAYGCPTIGPIPDFNCDGKLQVAVIGDSLVRGFGDTQNQNVGGYVLRAATAEPQIEFVNLGKLGLRTAPLLRDLKSKLILGRTNDTKTAIFEADVVVLDLGRNDRWLMGPPATTSRNLQLIAQLISRRSLAERQSAPYIIKAVLMLPNRGSQGPWVADLNKLILRSSTLQYPADLRFDQVSKRLLSNDQIHPTPKGYRSLSEVFVRYLKRTAAPRMLRLRPDTDVNGVFDLFE